VIRQRQGVAYARKQAVPSSSRQDVACQKAGFRVLAKARCCPKTRQDVAVRIFSKTKPPPRLSYHCLVATRGPVIGLHRDGLYLGAGDGARTRRSACLEGRWSQEHRLPGTNSHYRLFEECFLVLALAGQKLLHASIAVIGISFHLQAPSGSHEVSSLSRVYLIGLQK
jgi:hypothetical protein